MRVFVAKLRLYQGRSWNWSRYKLDIGDARAITPTRHVDELVTPVFQPTDQSRQRMTNNEANGKCHLYVRVRTPTGFVGQLPGGGSSMFCHDLSFGAVRARLACEYT